MASAMHSNTSPISPKKKKKKPGPGFPYLKGWFDYLVMSHVPGEPVNNVYMDRFHELGSMQKKLAYILELELHIKTGPK